MQEIKGKTAFGGIAIGKVKEIVKEKNVVRRVKTEDSQSEIARFEKARTKAVEQLEELRNKAVKEVGEDNAAIFEIHQVMLDDDDYLESIRNIIVSQQVNAEFAVARTGDNFAEMFTQMDDVYMKERASDVEDISNRIISILSGEEQKEVAVEEEAYIVVADDLAPSETIQLDREKVLAFVTRQGSVNSHTAILARTMNIPAVVCAPVEKQIDGMKMIVDGNEGKVLLDPDTETIKEYEQQKEEEIRQKERFFRLRGQDTVTKDGKEIKLYANIGGIKDVAEVLHNDAAGIGLFRSEFLYLQNQDYPDEEEQFHVYKTVAEMMVGKKVIIRTMDIGADKQIDYFNLDKEENPALGYRAVRICLDRIDIFKTQLRAIYRAGMYGNLAIMIPMIISEWEVKKVKEIIEEVKKELTEQQVPFKDLELGIMIGTPAAVMMSEELAKEVDFFSIGTNDLTQYTLAIDRQNANLDRYYDAHHPAVLRMIRMVIENAHKEGIWVGICGELGADTSLTELFVKMGIDELSVSPSMVLPVRDKILHTDTVSEQ